MCDVFHLDDVVVRRGFQEYIDNVRSKGLLDPPERLVGLIEATKTIAVSTAECERGFSPMNILASRVRSSFTIETLFLRLHLSNVLVHHFKNSALHYNLDHGKGHHQMTVRFGRENRTLDDEHDYDIIWKKLEA